MTNEWKTKKSKTDPEFEGEFAFRSNVERNRKRIINLPSLPAIMWEDEAVEKYWNSIGCMSQTNTNEAVGEDKR